MENKFYLYSDADSFLNYAKNELNYNIVEVVGRNIEGYTGVDFTDNNSPSLHFRLNKVIGSDFPDNQGKMKVQIDVSVINYKTQGVCKMMASMNAKIKSNKFVFSTVLKSTEDKKVQLIQLDDILENIFRVIHCIKIKSYEHRNKVKGAVN